MFAALMEIPGVYTAAILSLMGVSVSFGFVAGQIVQGKQDKETVEDAKRLYATLIDRAAEDAAKLDMLRFDADLLRYELDAVWTLVEQRGPSFKARVLALIANNTKLTSANLAMVNQVKKAHAAIEREQKRVRELEADLAKREAQGASVPSAETQSPVEQEVEILKSLIKILETGRDEDRETISRLRDKVNDLSEIIAKKNEQLREEKNLQRELGATSSLEGAVTVAKENAFVPAVPLRDAKTEVIWKICGEEVLVPLPQKLSEMGDWAEKWLGDKVVFTPGALKEIEAFDDYQRPERVYIGMLLLLTKQEMMTVPDGDKKKRDTLLKEYNRCLRELGWRDTETGGDGVDLLPKNFAGAPISFDRAIKNNSYHQPLRDLRIYYAVDNARKRVIVGSAPRHL